MSKTLQLAKDLIKFKSITPENNGAIEFVAETLAKIGFKCEILKFGEVTNLYARFGDAGKNFCFGGHTDVVPPGDEEKWSVPPFEPEVKDGFLYGRGTVDMKGAVAAFIIAAENFINKNPDFKNSISLLITGDEEGDAIDGTVKVIEWLKEKNEKIDAAIIGEPTNPSKLGEMIKVGRRGSVTFDLAVIGTQGHVAYPHLANNPITSLVNILSILQDYKFDNGNDYFDPTNLEITDLAVGNDASNVIPRSAKATFNIRFNDFHTSKSLIEFVESAVKKTVGEYKLDYRITGESFIIGKSELSDMVQDSAEEITGLRPELSTTGGTSDARFIKDLCPLVEVGLINQTAHKIDEKIAVKDLEDLTLIYERVLEKYNS